MSPEENVACTRIIIKNISMDTTEESIRDYFAFCGDITHMNLYNTDGNCKEAIVKFESNSAANTACFLNNALIDGWNVKVEPYPTPEDIQNPTSPSQRQPKSEIPTSEKSPATDSFSSIFSSLASSTAALASDVSLKLKDFDDRYSVSERVVTGATSAWQGTKKLATDVDDKFGIRDSLNSAVVSTKEKLSGSKGPSSPIIASNQPTSNTDQ